MMYKKKTILVILSFCFTPLLYTQNKVSFSNVIDLINSPNSPKDEGLNAFFDLGSWMGFSLSENESYTGFSGPYILGLEHGIWTSDKFTSLDLISKDGKSLLTKLNDSKQNYYPGRLENQMHFKGLHLKNTLIFTSNKTILITTQITNTGDHDLNFTPQWNGKIFHQIESFINKDDHLITQLDKEQCIYLIPITDETFIIRVDSYNYNISLNSITLRPTESTNCSIEIQYHPDQKKLQKPLLSKDVSIELEKNQLRWDQYLDITKSSILSNTEKLILTKSICTLINNWKCAAGALKHDGLFPSYHYKWFQGFWSWDSWKHAVALVKIEPELAKNQIKAMYDYQNMEGMIADCIYRDTTIESHNWRDTKPPLSSWAIWEIYKETQDTAFLIEMYPKLKKYHNWWYAYRDHDKDGYCEYGSTDGSLIAAKWESGMDNAVRFDSSKIVKGSNYSINSESVDLNSYLAMEKNYLSQMAQVLELSDRNSWRKNADLLNESIRKDFYDQESGYFYDINAETGDLLTHAMGPEGWTPVWCGIATKEQCAKIVVQMMDTNRFNTTVPLPTIDVSHPSFDPQNGYWRGPVWLDQLWFGINGLEKYGYTFEAEQLKTKVINNCEGLKNTGGSIRENYHPLTGKGLNAEHFSWSAAHLILLITE